MSQRACTGVVSPLAVGLSGLGILSDCVSITLVIFKSGEGKYCRGSKESVENDRSGLSALGVELGGGEEV